MDTTTRVMKRNKLLQNRLSLEKSPYLLQHAENPVAWFPWGEEAFEKAHREHKPVFLSIGYSTCHWCHVMAHESFEDPEVARLMNDAFVCIKVDREERPDIDSVYMTACQFMAGSGGWPLTIVMTPDKKPFFASTYIPRETRYGRIGMLQLIPQIRELWEAHHDEVVNASEKVAELLKQVTETASEGSLEVSLLRTTYVELVQRFDDEHGGFGDAPKFPVPHNLLYLLRYWRRFDERNALMIARQTLDAMRWGGIYDHIGGGFHRYSTDKAWIVPHFEKMLYDQALLALAYTEAFQATDDSSYRDTAEEVLASVLRDFASQEGGFYSAIDADAEGEEGKTYLWTAGEIETVLRGESRLFSSIFNITEKGNFAGQVAGERTGWNVPHRRGSWKELAKKHKVEETALRSKMKQCREKLFEVRKKRQQPDVDDKILADWNGLMTAALARAGRVFGEEYYTASASRAARFVLSRMRTAKGRLIHRYWHGEAAVPAFLDDYAFMVWGLIELYETTFDASHLSSAISLTEGMIEHFWDRQRGGFFLTADDGEALIVRKKEYYDGALPSGNSVAMLNLLRLAALIGKGKYREKAEKMGRAFSKKVSQAPANHAFFMIALDFLVHPVFEVVVAGKRGSEDTEEMLSSLGSIFIPNGAVLFRECDRASFVIDTIAPFVKKYVCIGEKATAYICHDQHCERPTTDINEMLTLLRRK